jgi:hypothetical protein
MDNTFRSAKKATVVDKENQHAKPLKGGVLSILNEKSEIVGWVRTLNDIIEP